MLLQLPDFVEGKLGGSELRIIREHIRDCPDCRKEEERIREIYASLPPRDSFSPVPESYWMSIVPRIHEKIDTQRHGLRLIPGWIYRFVFPAAAVSLIVILVFRADIFPPASATDELLTSVQQLSDEERTAVFNEYSATLPDEIDDYAVADSVALPLQVEAEEAATTGSFESIFENQLAPETLLESLSEEEMEQVMKKLQTQHYIMS